MPISKLALWLSIGSAIISVISVFLAERSYEITHRPFIGIVEATPTQLNKDGQPVVVSWQVTLKNAGSIPGIIYNHTNAIRITENGQTRFGDLYGEANKTIFLLPQGISYISGSASNDQVQKVIKGDAKLEQIIHLDYQYSGLLWTIKRYYEARLEMSALPNQPLQFSLMESAGD
jgi:hypothetical protein